MILVRVEPTSVGPVGMNASERKEAWLASCGDTVRDRLRVTFDKKSLGDIVGCWFSPALGKTGDHLDALEYFNNIISTDHQGPIRIVALDIDSSEAEKYKIANLSRDHRGYTNSRNVEAEYLLPSNIPEKAVEILTLNPAQEPLTEEKYREALERFKTSLEANNSIGAISEETNADWDTILQHTEWESIPDDWQAYAYMNPSEEIKNGGDVLLFRTHAVHTNPDLRDTEGDAIVHASFSPVIPGPSAIKRYDARKVYGGDERFTFITMYRANSGQTFYQDEQLELAASEAISGTKIEDIERFDLKSGQHFETDAQDCEILGVYMALLPEDTTARIKPSPVLQEGIKILRIDDKPEILAALNGELAKQNVCFSHAGTGASLDFNPN